MGLENSLKSMYNYYMEGTRLLRILVWSMLFIIGISCFLVVIDEGMIGIPAEIFMLTGFVLILVVVFMLERYFLRSLEILRGKAPYLDTYNGMPSEIASLLERFKDLDERLKFVEKMERLQRDIISEFSTVRNLDMVIDTIMKRMIEYTDAKGICTYYGNRFYRSGDFTPEIVDHVLRAGKFRVLNLTIGNVYRVSTKVVDVFYISPKPEKLIESLVPIVSIGLKSFKEVKKRKDSQVKEVLMVLEEQKRINRALGNFLRLLSEFQDEKTGVFVLNVEGVSHSGIKEITDLLQSIPFVKGVEYKEAEEKIAFNMEVNNGKLEGFDR